MKTLPKLEELDRLAQNNGKGFTRALLQSWGVEWPPKSGWLKAMRAEILSGAGDKIIREAKKPPRRPNGKKDRAARRQAREQQPVAPKVYAPTANNPNSLKSFYASWEWRTLRMEVLKTFGHRCQSCGNTPADKTLAGTPVKIVVDHIKPLSKFWHLRLDRGNLQVLCDECNMGKGAWDHTDYRPAEMVPAVEWGDSWDEIDRQLSKPKFN